MQARLFKGNEAVVKSLIPVSQRKTDSLMHALLYCLCVQIHRLAYRCFVRLPELFPRGLCVNKALFQIAGGTLACVHSLVRAGLCAGIPVHRPLQLAGQSPLCYSSGMSTSQKIISYILIVLYFGAAYYISARICLAIAKRKPKLLDTHLRTIVTWAFFIVLLIPILLWMNSHL